MRWLREVIKLMKSYEAEAVAVGRLGVLHAKYWYSARVKP